MVVNQYEILRPGIDLYVVSGRANNTIRVLHSTNLKLYNII